MLNRDLKVGDILTFFYPSTEWEMAQAFECTCGEQMCLRMVSGAKDMDSAVLSKYFLTKHIIELLNEE